MGDFFLNSWYAETKALVYLRDAEKAGDAATPGRYDLLCVSVILRYRNYRFFYAPKAGYWTVCF